MTTNYELHCGDCLEVMAGMEAESVHSIVTDPPYGLSKEPDIVEVLTHWLAGDKYTHGSNGFMLAKWDSFVPGPEYWREAYRVLKPGGYLLCFASTRTFDLMAIALRLAGFEQHPFLAYIGGQGFPKATNLGKMIDRHFDAEREVVGKVAGMGKQNPEWNGTAQGRTENSFKPEYDATIPTTPEAQQWDGWFYGKQSLKPAIEPILMFQKPFEKGLNGAQNVLKHGTGAVNIDGSRIGTDLIVSLKGLGQNKNMNDDNWEGIGKRPESTTSIGRWPANVLLSHSPGCVQVGTRRVKGTGEVTQGGKDGGGFDIGSSDGTRRGKHPGFADADGMETVEEWQCEPGGQFIVPSYEVSFAGKMQLFEPSASPAYLLGQLPFLIQAIRENSTNDNTLLPNACEFYCTAGKLQEDSADGLAGDAAHVLGLSKLPNSLGGYPTYPRFCDELLHRVLVACRVSVQELVGVLEYAVHQLKHTRIHVNQSPDRQSNWDDSRQTSQQKNKILNSTSVVLSERREDEKKFGIRDTLGLEDDGHPNNTVENRISEFDNLEILSYSADKIAAVRLLGLVCADLAYRFILPACIIQRKEIVVNLEPCAVRLLDEQSGQLTSGGHKAGDMIQINHGGYAGGRGTFSLHRDYPKSTGGASRFFYTSKASRFDRNDGVLRDENGQQNSHATVKPTDLMAYLCRLVTPPNGTVLDPFCGSGSTGVAALLEGFSFIGIDLDARHIAIAEDRCGKASQMANGEFVTKAGSVADTADLPLFLPLDNPLQ